MKYQFSKNTAKDAKIFNRLSEDFTLKKSAFFRKKEKIASKIF